MLSPIMYERKNSKIDATIIKNNDFFPEISIDLFYFISYILPNIYIENLSLPKIYIKMKLCKSNTLGVIF